MNVLDCWPSPNKEFTSTGRAYIAHFCSLFHTVVLGLGQFPVLVPLHAFFKTLIKLHSTQNRQCPLPSVLLTPLATWYLSLCTGVTDFLVSAIRL